MKQGDLVYIKNIANLVTPTLLQVLRVFDHGLEVMVLSGSNIGAEHYVPWHDNEIVVVSEI